MSGVSTYGSMAAQQALNALLQKQLNASTAENSSGLYADIPKTLGANNTLLFTLQSKLSQQTVAQTASASVGGKLTTMQTALTSINSLVDTMSTSAIAAQSNTGSTSVLYNSTAAEASGSLDQMFSLLNTSYNGQYLFSGNDSGTQTMASSYQSGPSAAISDLVNQAVANNGGNPLDADSVSSLIDSLSSMFSDSSGSSSSDYSGVFFTANDNGNPVTFSTGGTSSMSYDMKGSSQGFRDVVQGMVMMSLLSAPSTQLGDDAKAQLLTNATTLVNKGQGEITVQTATLGATQSQLTRLADTQTAAASNTKDQIASLTNVDAYTAATQLQALKTQLQASYEITSQISQLSFVNYMK